MPNIPIEWEKLLAVPFNVPLDWLGFELTPISEHVYKLNDNQYILALNFTYNDNRLKYFGFVWTASKGIAEWIFNGNVLADDGVNVSPPECLLPAPSTSDYAVLVEYGKKNFPENFDETVLGQTRVSFGDYTFFFRKCFPAARDLPIAIKVDLRPDKYFLAAF